MGAWDWDIAFEAFGVRISVTANRLEALERLPELMPPSWRPCPLSEAEHRMALLGDDRGTYEVNLGGTSFIQGIPLELAVEILDRAVRGRIALEAPNRIFVHAGVAAYEGRAIVIPGKSFAGKTTLVAALVRAGAIYYSDEYAALDLDGLVHPFPKPLSLRDGNQQQTDHQVESLGGTPGENPLPVGLVVVTIYRPEAVWRPKRLSPGQGVLALLTHTVPARERPEQTLRAIARAVEGATLIESDRGEAGAIAPQLLAESRVRTA
jgi:hypothetical protein